MLLLILIIGFFTSCEQTRTISTTKMELRQLVNKEETQKHSNGSYFIIVANYSSSETKQDVIKMFVKVDNSYYQMLKLDLEKVKVVIDNNIEKPYLIVKKDSFSHTKSTDAEILYFVEYNDRVFLHCPEKYLPEKLLSINLN